MKAGLQDLRKRTKQFALRMIRLYGALPNTDLQIETNELIAIFVTTIKKVKARR